MAGALENYVNTVQNLSSQGNFAQLCEFIGKSADILAKNASHLDNVLATLDIQQHSLGILGILCVKYNMANIPDFETLFVQTQEFITSCNGEHVRYATDSYSDLCHKLTVNLVEQKQPMRGISILTKSISKIQLFESQLTSIHADLCQLCLLSKNMRPALQFLDVDITDISKEGGHYDAKDFLLYYYYGGMIYTALKNYDRALYMYEINALKNYDQGLCMYEIVSIECPQKLRPGTMNPLCQSYHDLASTYATNNPADLHTTVTKHVEVFIR
ncbi:COP9 signalosome complex subunit 3-like, partial [Mizuhopecten yessoensis]|uniref:COP9 signalosome complex subunit 3-like n=1 Tax=Mizuhopecten yessoensis TaxID=6573 RepID=UPI000B45F0DB